MPTPNAPFVLRLMQTTSNASAAPQDNIQMSGTKMSGRRMSGTKMRRMIGRRMIGPKLIISSLFGRRTLALRLSLAD